MKKLFIILLVILAFSGCETVIEEKERIKTICLNGVTYYFYRTGYKGALAIKLDKNSKIVPCKNEKEVE